MIYVYPVDCVSAPRQVHKDKYNPSPHVKRYRAYRDELRARRVFVPTPFHHAIFVMKMPQTWSLKKRASMEGTPHLSKPDRDNLEKALLDACFGEDCHVWDGRTTKLWGLRGLLILSAQPIPVVLPFELAEYYEATRRDSLGASASAFYPHTPI